ncbi:MAG: C25 family cysteine peptidase [Crocinitomicaceae bacterium]|nr:C25 family cysteine peptidase [Crocinitomicaceae bacterium]
MNKFLLFLSFSLICIFANGQSFQLLSNDDSEIVFEHHLDVKAFKHQLFHTKKHIDFSQMYEITTSEISAPQLPRMSVSIALPARGKPQIQILYDSFVEIQNVEVLPSKGNLKRNVDPQTILCVYGDVYGVNEFYPSQIAQLATPFISRDMRGVTVSVFPYQYNPVTKTLRVYENLRIKLINDVSLTGENEMRTLPSFVLTKKMNRNLFLNGSDVLKYTPKEETGELLIICPPEMDSIVKIFANWKIQKGIKTKIVLTSETGNGATNIKDYVSNYYAENGDLVHLLLVGDHDVIPAYTYGESIGEQLWSDSYYGQLTGSDFYPELLVGRFSGNLQEVNTMIQRTIEYEKNPVEGNWMQKTMGIASGEGAGFGLNGLADWEHSREMGNTLIFAGYVDAYEFYEGSRGGNDANGNPTASMVSAALNDGVGLLNYTGHGDLNLFVTSSFTSTSVSDLNNHGKYPWVISVACNNGTFPYGTCISEKWLRASKNGTPTGAIAASASSILMAWTQPMKTQKEITNFIANSDLSNPKISLGGIFYNAQMKMLEQYPGSDGNEVMQTWIFFGDPTVEIRNEETRSMLVSHVSQINQGETSISVYCDVENTLISISQENIFLGKGNVVGGSATINFPTLSTNLPLIVTATKQNFKAYQGAIQVGNGPLGTAPNSKSDFHIFPNPANKNVNVIFKSISNCQIDIVDATGKIVKTQQFEAGTVNESISLEGISEGMYQLVISNPEMRFVEKLVVE